MPPTTGYQPVYLNSPELVWPIPRFHLRVLDLASPGCAVFFSTVQVPSLMHECVSQVLKWLYINPESCPKNIRSVTLVLKEMDGVAFTHSSELDSDHKEIHFSTAYIQGASSRSRDEIYGVLIHELVHCFQYDGDQTCPGGLIEGIADWVRLRSGFAPPHWKRGGKKWDDGYEKTAYFLEWIDNKYFGGDESGHFVPQLNRLMKEAKYDEEYFKHLTGHSIQNLWEQYCKEISPPSESPPSGIPTHCAVLKEVK